jgi:hypothetical protein
MRDGQEPVLLGLPDKCVSRFEIRDRRLGRRQPFQRFRDSKESVFERMRVLRHGNAMLKAGISAG